MSRRTVGGDSISLSSMILFPRIFALLSCTFGLLTHASEQVNDHVLVVGKKPSYLNDLNGLLPIDVVDTSAIEQTGSIAELFTASPSVNFNGQGGLLQTLSIRGLSRWRIQTMIEGVPIHSERRSGNAAEFIAPGMVGSAYVLSGAASTQLGSGALGGGIDLQLAATTTPTLSTTLDLQQDYRSIQTLGGRVLENSRLYWGGSLRHANNGKDSANQPLFNGFEQSVIWIRQTSEEYSISDALFVISSANNIGKANSDPINSRLTRYPNNDHWLAKLDFDWLNAGVYAHKARLDTSIVRPEQRTNSLQNAALGWGARVGDTSFIGNWQLDWQLAFDARRGVKASEQEATAEGELVFDRTNLDAHQQAWSLSTDIVRQLKDWRVATGVRLEHIAQHSDVGTSLSVSDSNLSAFLVAKKQWSQSWSTRYYLSSAFRTPTLTERFFFGNTPRGISQGDANLETENAKNIQLDIDYQGQHVSLGVSVFHQQIDNYIERIDLSSLLQQYVNLGDAEIDGVSYQSHWILSPNLYLKLHGQWLWGEDNNGMPINDVSPHQHTIKLGWHQDSHELWINMAYRHAHRRVGSSELPTKKVVHFRAGYQHMLSPSLSMRVLASNITDKVYAVSTDDLAPNALGPNIEFNLTYVF
ncbi:MAG: hypothetical protein Alis3KO_13090 [Aliiglaciecola sp.]